MLARLSAVYTSWGTPSFPTTTKNHKKQNKEIKVLSIMQESVTAVKELYLFLSALWSEIKGYDKTLELKT